MKTIYKYRNLRRLCTLYKHFQTENLGGGLFLAGSATVYPVLNFIFIDIYMDIQCSTAININIQVASWRNG